jgi:hypothetical protein
MNIDATLLPKINSFEVALSISLFLFFKLHLFIQGILYFFGFTRISLFLTVSTLAALILIILKSSMHYHFFAAFRLFNAISLSINPI